MVKTKRPTLDEKIPETIDGETGLPSGIPRRTINLSNIRDVRLEMSRLYRQVDYGEVDSSEANKRVWLLRQIHDCLVSAELERRIAELEEQTTRGGLGNSALLEALN